MFVGQKFNFGKIAATPAAAAALEEAGQDPMQFLARHGTGDWGDLDKGDKAQNDRACAHEGELDKQDRILSSYVTNRMTKIWIITEFDRSVTTILLPSDY